jgi:hypothetical protein
LIGDEGSDNYLEGFSISFNATKACYEMDFRQNMCLYCLTNNVIIDKTGFGVEDIRTRSLRLSCAADESYQSWASATITPGFKELRYIKFVLRASGKGQPLQTDDAECAFVIESLKAAMKSNSDALRGFWFGYALDAHLHDATSLTVLRTWVCEHGGEAWWRASWEPLVRACADEKALLGNVTPRRRSLDPTSPIPTFPARIITGERATSPARRRGWRFWRRGPKTKTTAVAPKS